jgi:uncharacterized membrane protein YeiB
MQQGMEELRQLVVKVRTISSTGTYSETINARLEEYQTFLPTILFFYPVVLGMFLIGFLAARKGIITNFTNHLQFFRKLFWWGLVIGIFAVHCMQSDSDILLRAYQTGCRY